MLIIFWKGLGRLGVSMIILGALIELLAFLYLAGLTGERYIIVAYVLASAVGAAPVLLGGLALRYWVKPGPHELYFLPVWQWAPVVFIISLIVFALLHKFILSASAQ